ALAELLASVFPQERVATVLGGPEVGATFTTLPFDHLFFTGSTAVGRKVALAAAPNLTPVTLELGGKSPAIVAPDYPLATAAARIAAGKLLNAGQTCIAPDYVLLPTAAREGFVQALRSYVQQHYPALRDTPDYTSIVSERQYARLKHLVEDARAKGATVVTLPGEDAHDPARRVFAPTLLLGVDDGMAVMQEEIFGPILPLVGYGAIEEAVAYVNRHPQPLALYHFDHDRARTERVLDQTLAGGVSVNDAVLHIVQSRLPFGGVGPSGMGHYHGHAGFLTFSKQKSVFRQARFSSLALLRPPYGAFAERMLKFLTR
ncbi:MAG TPA: aldehyde dehydrogenase family protein, partial [Rhodanobacteraceae bacterium]|nr:aldehyde dehydrogenase family protein [Rhodanobacteraceae bacterium]